MNKPLLILALTFPLHANSQNLVPNPGFETITTCNLTGSGIKNLQAPPWNSPDGSTPDLFNVCSLSGLWGIPSNQFGYQQPHSGNGYAGAVQYQSSDYREYLQVRLTSPLIANQLYCVSLYTTVSSPRYIAVNKIGMYISSSAFSGNNPMNSLNLLPQVVDNNIIKDTSQWALVRGVYLARGGEEYIVLGNFAPRLSIDTFHFPSTLSSSTYYYFDDIDIHLSTLIGCSTTSSPPIDSTPQIRFLSQVNQITISKPSGLGHVLIYNALGQLLYKKSFNQNQTINIHFLPSGVYFFYYYDDKRKLSKKFPVVH
jgi:hypothetical protein